MDMPWLDALEDLAPALQTAFLDEGERATRREALEAIAGARAELARLQALEQDVRWGAQALEAEKLERLRQYLAGRGEISAGDQLVLRHLRGKARERQRYGLGLPLLLAGGAALFLLFRKNRKT
jgi:zinc/manganese transport system permease protein